LEFQLASVSSELETFLEPRLVKELPWFRKPAGPGFGYMC